MERIKSHVTQLIKLSRSFHTAVYKNELPCIFITYYQFQVTHGVYFANGFSISNSILLEAPEGAIIIDTTESVEQGRNVLAAYRKFTTSPIKAIIYTQGNSDHVSGASVSIGHIFPWVSIQGGRGHWGIYPPPPLCLAGGDDQH